MTDHADTIRRAIRHSRLRRTDDLRKHPSDCKGCAADAALSALLADRRQAIDALRAAWHLTNNGRCRAAWLSLDAFLSQIGEQP